MKIGILYICTGNYTVFWEDFYESFSKYFCTNSEIHYFVFSDKEMDFTGKKNVHFNKIQNQPWPLITLLRFQTFLAVEEQLKECDYLVFFNSNLNCVSNISEEDFLPSKDEKLLFYHHGGYIYTKKIFHPYERNKKSTAYIPYSCGGTYVGGGIIGGETIPFLDMCRTLKQNIETDLKQNYIARWHDESHINHFLCTLDKYKLLHPGYCYPVGFDLPFEKKIVGVSKQDKFDVQNFKFVTKKLSFWQKFYRRLDKKILPYMRFVFSLLKKEHVK